MIYHIISQEAYDALDDIAPYAADSLKKEGFIHCTAEPELLAAVANRYYQKQSGPYLLMCIDEERIGPTVRWEESNGKIYPHIYGPLNWNAVEQVIDFPRETDGSFVLPPGL
ncbi:MAG: DUF952 domain-containing protein [Caldilineaceae bacterium]|nr:DUF952 domain-containing protein [Caldilineaceae bacterium]HRJ44865.1 DUF952 domain-containing protein [Caldilineaceae bacterium]